MWKDAYTVLNVEAGGTYRKNCPERFNNYYLALTTCNWFKSGLSQLLIFVFIAESLGPDEIFIGSLLLRHLQLLQFNAHEIFETCMEAPNKFKGSKNVYVAAGIYPTVAMFNHDCHPALSR